MATAMEKRAAVVAKYGEGLINTSDIKWGKFFGHYIDGYDTNSVVITVNQEIV